MEQAGPLDVGPLGHREAGDRADVHHQGDQEQRGLRVARVLGVDRKGEEYYQITLGGSADQDATIGKIVGPAFSGEAVVDAVETVINTYVELRQNGERFIDTYRRVGKEPFKERLYAAD